MAAAGISTLKARLGWAAASDNTPNSFTFLTRINAIGGVSIEPEQIDASALEDDTTKYIDGRSDIGGGTVNITVNVTNETITEWTSVFTASESARASGGLWWEVYSPDLTQAFFFRATTPPKFAMPELNQNELLTVDIPLTVNNYVGLGTAVAPT